MTPEYLKELADLADPNELWRMLPLKQMDLPPEQKRQLDMGVALRRMASFEQEKLNALEKGKSLLITPLSFNGTARRLVDTPLDHERLRDPHYRTGNMTYEEAGIRVAITVGKKAVMALNDKNELLLVQDETAHELQLINLGPFTKKRAEELKEYLDRLAIFVP